MPVPRKLLSKHITNASSPLVNGPIFSDGSQSGDTMDSKTRTWRGERRGEGGRRGGQEGKEGERAERAAYFSLHLNFAPRHP
ncbi:hypothetical protein EYF80_030475 [Liparis tanakae]|uniref:Uncharacterized protein n=1 Tax=Liparis tanakae TaxID=230148 RepID=A0A4Z2H0B5_9TELE|nr:hypothetical protein EYF80_030475 [Liparis tanakae]